MLTAERSEGSQVKAQAGSRAPWGCPTPHTVWYPAGTARLPEASQSPLVLKQAVRKPLEAVLRYLGEQSRRDGGS